jgi:NAD(P)-dependent dehydrogenase (short-subunit alcohol dehydrogenase family)
MQPSRLAGLKLMVTGLSAATSREVICSLLAAGAEVACVGDEADTAQLQRDLGLYGLTVRALPIDLGSASEVRLFAANLQGGHDLPHIIVCCCAGGRQCPSSVLSDQLSPPLFLHLITRDCALALERLLDIGTPDLQSIIGRRLIFNRGAPIRRAMIGRNAFALERRGLGRSTVRRPNSGQGRSSRHHAGRRSAAPHGNQGMVP